MNWNYKRLKVNGGSRMNFRLTKSSSCGRINERLTEEKVTLWHFISILHGYLRGSSPAFFTEGFIRHLDGFLHHYTLGCSCFSAAHFCLGYVLCFMKKCWIKVLKLLGIVNQAERGGSLFGLLFVFESYDKDSNPELVWFFSNLSIKFNLCWQLR